MITFARGTLSGDVQGPKKLRASELIPRAIPPGKQIHCEMIDIVELHGCLSPSVALVNCSHAENAPPRMHANVGFRRG